VHVIVHASVVDLSFDDIDAEGSSSTYGFGALRGGEQGL
jgi:hypothetical protein